MLLRLFSIACLALTVYASHGQGIDETDVDNPLRQLFSSRLYHGGVFIDEHNLENPDGKYDVTEEDEGQGNNEQDVSNPWAHSDSTEEDSGEGINESDLNNPWRQLFWSKLYRGSVFIDEHNLENPDGKYDVSDEEDAGQGIDEENINNPWGKSDSSEEDAGQGIDEENVNNPWGSDGSEEDSGQGIDEENINNPWGNGSSEEDPGQGIDEENINNPWGSSEEDSEVALQKSIPDMIPDVVIKLNKAIDFLLDLVRSAFTDDGQLTIPLPPFNKNFGSGLYKGTFSANDGYFKNPASLERTGDVAISKEGDKISLEVALGLKTLEAGYNAYALDIMSIHQKGHLKFGVGHDSLKLKASLTYSPKCHFEVSEIAVDKLDGIKVDIDGLGVFQSLFDVLKKWLLDNFEGQFKTILNKTLQEKVKVALQKHDICDKIPKF